MKDILKEIAEMQENYQKMIDEKRFTKKALCDLCVPFGDKYSLTDLQTLQIARNELSISEIVSIFEDKGVTE